MPSRKGRILTGASDQALYSLGNFLITAIVAHFSTPRAFGTYAVLAASFLIASGVNRGLTAEPYIIRHSANVADGSRDIANKLIARSLVFSLSLSVILVGLASVNSGETAKLFLAFAVSVPILFVQDYLRFVALALGRPVLALANDVTVLIAEILGLAALVKTNNTNPYDVVFVWGAASLVGAGVGFVALGLSPRFRGLRGAGDRALSARLALDNLISGSTQQGTLYIVAAEAGLAAAGGLRAAQTVFTIPAVVTLGLQAAVTPELVRLRHETPRRMVPVVRRLAVLVTAANLAFLLLVVLLPDDFGRELFGENWSKAEELLVLVGSAQVAGAVVNVLVASLRALADARRTLICRYVGATLTIGLVVPATAVGGVQSAATALVAAVVLQIGVWGVAFRRSSRQLWNPPMSDSGPRHQRRPMPNR